MNVNQGEMSSILESNESVGGDDEDNNNDSFYKIDKILPRPNYLDRKSTGGSKSKNNALLNALQHSLTKRMSLAGTMYGENFKRISILRQQSKQEQIQFDNKKKDLLQSKAERKFATGDTENELQFKIE